MTSLTSEYLFFVYLIASSKPKAYGSPVDYNFNTASSLVTRQNHN